MHSGRSPLANVNGLVVLITVFLATAQVLSMMTPASGLPALALSLFFLIAILQLLAAGVDRIRFLRVWAVTLLSSFTIKFILLTALTGPADRPLARALQVLVEGLTLGAFSQPRRAAPRPAIWHSPRSASTSSVSPSCPGCNAPRSCGVISYKSRGSGHPAPCWYSYVSFRRSVRCVFSAP